MKVSLQRPQRGVASSAAPLNPVQIAAGHGGGLTFWLDASYVSGLTITQATSAVTVAADRGGSGLTMVASGGAATPVLIQNAINGRPSLRTTSAGGEKLFCVSGAPAAGADIPTTIYVAGRVRLNVGSGFPYLAVVGDPAFGAYNSFALGQRTTQWAAFAQTGSPIGALGGTADDRQYIAELGWDGTSFTERLNGVLIAGPTAPAAFHTSGGGFPAGFGLAPNGGGYNGDVDICEAVWRIGSADSLAVRALHEQYLSSRLFGSIYGLPDLVACLGDSLTQYSYWDAYSSGAGDSPHSWPQQLSSQTGMGDWGFYAFNDGHAGQTTSSITSLQTSTGLCSPLRRNSLAVIFTGTNDFGTGNITPGVSQSTFIANVQTLYNQLIAAGFQTVIVCTLFPWIGWNVAAWQGYNSALTSTFPHIADLASVSAFTNNLSIVSGAWQGAGNTYDDVYRCASGGAKGHTTAAGSALVAATIAAVILQVKR